MKVPKEAERDELHAFARLGDIARISNFIAENPKRDIDEKDEHLRTALHLAAYANKR